MDVWLNTLGSIFVVSLISLVGIFAFLIKEKTMKKILLVLVSFSAGALLGDAFIHILPEIVELGFTLAASLNILFGIFIFMMLERVIQWRHCHMLPSKSHIHPFGYMNLLGDMFHNLTDGMIIAGSYMLNAQLGIATTIAVIAHEIPQEMGDFGVLLHAGFSREKALIMNFASALAAILGGTITLIAGGSIEGLPQLILPLTAGGFIYIAGSDLIPEIQKECAPKASMVQIISFILGIGVMYLLTFFGA